MKVESTEAGLVQSARAGDEAAWERLVRAHEPALFRLALAVLRHEEDARDACQDALAFAFRGLADFDPANRLDLWLRRIVVNRSRDVLRRRKVRRAAAHELGRMPERPPGPRDFVSDGEDRARVLRVLSGLPDEYRETLVLHLVEDRPYAELAEILDVSVNAVRIRVHRGLALVRQRLKECDP
jgi:RNA polymerase sigma-70 factor (ECF subfamily)